MLVVYLLFPRIQGTLWGLPVDAHGALTGLSEIMRPGSINSLGESTTPALRVTFEGAMPSPRELYWRGLVLTDTDGQSWSRRRTSPAEPESFHALGEPCATVTLEPSNKPRGCRRSTCRPSCRWGRAPNRATPSSIRRPFANG